MEFTLFEKLQKLLVHEWISLGIAFVLAIGIIVSLAKKRKTAEPVAQYSSIRILVYGALCIAISFILSYLKLFSMPQGGSITVASVLPLALFSYWFGFSKGLLVGCVAGILQFIQKPEMIHWIQPFFDYIFAFGCFSLAGLKPFHKSLPLGLAVGGVGRIICSTISGAIFFAEYAPENMNPWIYSSIYNLGALGPDILICIIIAVIPAVAKLFDQIHPKPEKTNSPTVLSKSS